MVKQKQLNVRISEDFHNMIELLTGKYGSKTKVIEVAVALLYTRYVNQGTPEEKPPAS